MLISSRNVRHLWVEDVDGEERGKKFKHRFDYNYLAWKPDNPGLMFNEVVCKIQAPRFNLVKSRPPLASICTEHCPLYWPKLIPMSSHPF